MERLRRRQDLVDGEAPHMLNVRIDEGREALVGVQPPMPLPGRSGLGMYCSRLADVGLMRFAGIILPGNCCPVSRIVDRDQRAGAAIDEVAEVACLFQRRRHGGDSVSSLFCLYHSWL